MYQLSAVVFITLYTLPYWAVSSYEFVIEDNPFISCKTREEFPIEEVFDMSNLQFTRGDDDIIIWNGTFTVKPFVAEKNISASVKSQRLVAGIWNDDILNSDWDLCTSIFSTNTVQHAIFGKIEPKTCPLQSDITYVVPPSPLIAVFDTSSGKLKNGVYRFFIEFGPIDKPIACITFSGEMHS